jgi:hypothetical protein
MNLSFGKIIFFLTLLCTVAFAGGIEEDSGPEEVMEHQTSDVKNSDTELTTRKDIVEYQDISGSDCMVKYALGYVNDPDFVAWSCK